MTEKQFQWPGRRPNDPAHDMLLAFLVMDIQHNSEWAHELADQIAQVKSGKLPVWERIGNAYRLEVSENRAWLEDLVDDNSPAQTVNLKDLCKAIEAWIECFKL
jgi:hypothetical protein